MKKDIEWLRERLETSRDISRWMIKKSDLSSGSRHHFFCNLAEVEETLDLLDQLDEPEKVVVPKFVAEYIQEGHELGVDLGTAMTIEAETLKHIRDYIKNNEETFARAWLDGYTVEEEPLYYALVKGHELIDGDFKYFNLDALNSVLFVGSRLFTEMGESEWNRLGINDSNADFIKEEDEQKYLVSSRESAGFWFLSKNNDNEVVIGTNKDYYDKKWENLKLTEQEIKDYDSRYWAFAVKVEEMAEYETHT